MQLQEQHENDEAINAKEVSSLRRGSNYPRIHKSLSLRSLFGFLSLSARAANIHFKNYFSFFMYLFYSFYFIFLNALTQTA